MEKRDIVSKEGGKRKFSQEAYERRKKENITRTNKPVREDGQDFFDALLSVDMTTKEKESLLSAIWRAN